MLHPVRRGAASHIMAVDGSLQGNAGEEVGLELGLSGFTALARTLRIPVMQAAGLTITPMGLPTLFNGESHVSVMFEVSEKCLSRINASRESELSVLEHNQPSYARARA